MNRSASNSNNPFIFHFLKQIRQFFILLLLRKHFRKSMSYSFIYVGLLQRAILKS